MKNLAALCAFFLIYELNKQKSHASARIVHLKWKGLYISHNVDKRQPHQHIQVKQWQSMNEYFPTQFNQKGVVERMWLWAQTEFVGVCVQEVR